MMIFELPTTLEVNGKKWKIRTDYRDILTVLLAFDDPEMGDSEKLYVCLKAVYEDFDTMPPSDYKAAFEAALTFIDHDSGDKHHGPRTMDWEQDANILFPAINSVAGYEVREAEYIHWWTFLGMFMQIGEGVYSTVLSLRQKKARGKKLEKWEREWWQNNIKICRLQPKETEEDRKEKERLKAILG